MPKPSKKAKLSKPAVDNATPGPAEDPELANPLEDNVEIPHDEPPPMDQENLVAQGIDPMEHTAEPASPARASPAPAKYITCYVLGTCLNNTCFTANVH